MKKKEMNIEKAKTHLILFGSITDPGGGGGDPGGGGGGGGGGDPTQGCIDQLVSQTAGTVANDIVSTNITNVDTTHRQIRYTWTAYRSIIPGLFRYDSLDIGYQENISGAWQFTNIDHQSVTLVGVTPTFSLIYTDVIPPNGVVSNPYTAYMELTFSVRATSYCVGYPIEITITHSPSENVRKVFTV